ncbi:MULTISPECIES: AAA family ATPase [unclassified Burkholderia]|uniref:AAA family ATPase n=1 Tax=unclassified Burkholderia TaxID=2613784 RepID=UPI001423A015|nr:MULTISPECIES: AAA family ATPase [unclassified Burkholderia]NIE86295.1 AAA family ATPase [Burkholderia sp. Tr-860]NIF66170.1 AAA family ATPase [Burkholderia sp. Cy-647]NIF94772.1 AAA family ATPase [Burkholderia sp. Ax-1720]
MLTKLEAHGFKNLLNFSVSFGPFNCIAGLNGVGKSNIFDAIKFLSLLSDKSIMEAALAVRDSVSSDPLDIFWTSNDFRADKLSLAVEMIVPLDLIDDFGRKARATSTFLRYEVELARDAQDESSNSQGIYLAREALTYINKGEAANKLHFPLSASLFRDQVVVNKRKGAGYISTQVMDDGITEIHLHQDGGSSGQPQKIPAHRIPKTVVANTNSAAWPTVLAARREMQSWRFLSLEPSAMRRSNKMHEESSVGADGGKLASTLYKLQRRDQNVCSCIASRLSEIIPTSDVRVDVDQVRQLLTVEVKERSGAFLPARALSDGTLRFLALCIMAEDPDFKGLLCFEEPENGIHPAKMNAILGLLKELAVDAGEPTGEDNPMRQIFIATHSPALVKLESPNDLIYADIVKVRGLDGNPASTIRCKSLQDSWRNISNNSYVDKGSIIAYLTLPPNSQIELDLED